MWESVIETVVANGAWAVLFCLLLVYELKDSRKREQKYQDTITSLGDSLSCVKAVAKDVEEIKYDVRCGFGLQELQKEATDVASEEVA